MSASPLAGRSGAVMVWTGKEMVIWGGVSCKAVPCQGDTTDPLGDGAAYDPAADRWRALPQSPMAARFVRGISTDREIVYWGGEDYKQAFADGAAYDPAADTWRRIPTWSGRLTQGVWGGREMVVWGGTVPDGPSTPRATPIRSAADGQRYRP